MTQSSNSKFSAPRRYFLSLFVEDESTLLLLSHALVDPLDVVSVQVDASDDREVVLVGSATALSVEESLQVLLVDVSQTDVVDGLVGGLLAEAFRRLQLLLELL